MTTRTFLTRLAAAAVVALAVAAPAARAQNMAAANAAFDARQSAWLGNLQRQNAQAQQQLYDRYVRDNLPRLQAGYQQLNASGQNPGMSFQRYAYYDLMSAGGTNVQGGLDAQRAQFAGIQRANATVQAGHASYNAGWAQNSQRQTAAVENWTNQTIRGVAPYGQTQTMLPHYLPQGQVYQTGGNTYAQDPSGAYYRLENQAWVRVN